jgi:Flp pilus assembly protein TadG
MTMPKRNARKTAGRPGLVRLLRRAKAETGATAVEFALVAPLLLAVLFGVMEAGRAIFTQAVIYYAAQEATRWAMVNPPIMPDEDLDTAAGKKLYEDRIQAVVDQHLIIVSPHNTVAIPVVAADPDPADNTREISVTVQYQFTWMMPYISKWTGPIQLSSFSRGILAENN